MSLVVVAGLLSGGCAWEPSASGPAPRSEPVGAAEGGRQVQAAATPAGRHLVADRAAEVAVGQVGAPYRYGGAGPGGFDCSGLVQYAYRQAGLAVPRTTGELWRHAAPVDRDSMRTGDVLFFNIDGKPSHVGIYLGGGRFVHAPSSGRQVTTESLASDYYRNRLLRAGRLIAGHRD
jgi:cell wall-associated NlpC family hydrolase